MKERKELVKFLTPRQRELLALVAQGYNNEACARRMFIEPKSLEKLLGKMFRTLALSYGEDYAPRVMAARIYWETQNAA